MNPTPHFFRSGFIALLLSALSLSSFAHGDEPHGDEPHGSPAASGAASSSPRLEAATDAFEMVARLQGETLTLFINRFETNEPVLQAKVELESGDQKAVAAYQADLGGYVVRDAAFMKAISQPGTHALVATVVAGEDADLLEGKLAVAANREATSGSKGEPQRPAVLALSGALAASAVGGGAFYLRRRKVTEGDAR